MGAAFLYGKNGGREKGKALYVWADSGKWDLLYTGTSKTLTGNANNVSLWSAPINFEDYMCLKAVVEIGGYTVTTNNSGGTVGGPNVVLSDFGGLNFQLARNGTYASPNSSVSVSGITRFSYLYKVGKYYATITNSSEDQVDTPYGALIDGLVEPLAIKFNESYRFPPITSNINLVGGFSLPNNASANSVTVSIKIYGQK